MPEDNVITYTPEQIAEHERRKKKSAADEKKAAGKSAEPAEAEKKQGR